MIESEATRTARRVLPVPPGPVRVRRRLVESRSRAVAMSRVLPTNEVVAPGRLVGTSSDRRGGNVAGSPSITTS